MWKIHVSVCLLFIQQPYSPSQKPTPCSGMQTPFLSPRQMMNTMTGIITMSSSNRWMTKIGVGGADSSVLWLNISKYLAKLRHWSLEFLEYSEFLLWPWANHTLPEPSILIRKWYWNPSGPPHLSRHFCCWDQKDLYERVLYNSPA